MKIKMAILIILILLISSFTGCGVDQDKIQNDFITMLEKPASEESIKAIADYLDKYLPKLDVNYASNMVVGYEHYVLGFDNEGIDYEEWTAKYENFINSTLTKLYDIKAFEQNNPMAKDTVLQITWEELAKRAYDIELFIQENKENELIKEDAVWIYRNYINAMVMGTNGTPVFDYKTYKFSEAAKSAYAAFINTNPQSTTAWVLTEYYTYLNSIGYTMNYNDKVSSKSYFDTCDWLVSEAGKRVFQ